MASHGANSRRDRLSNRRLGRADFALPPERLAPRLLGAVLVRMLPDGSRLSGRIVEVEAYLGVRDRAAHSFGGRRTERNEAMYAVAGTAYVYFTYGMHHCFNVVCGELGEPVAVLVRALEPLEGLASMRAARGSDDARSLCSGPGKLCQALALTRAQNGLDLAASQELWIEQGDGPLPASRTRRDARIGIGSAGVWASKPLRWLAAGNPHVSKPLRRGPWRSRGV